MSSKKNFVEACKIVGLRPIDHGLTDKYYCQICKKQLPCNRGTNSRFGYSYASFGAADQTSRLYKASLHTDEDGKQIMVQEQFQPNFEG